uniref:Uncharacterized protein n=1 Tax=Arundo donax TaxID=35708 RepID=A0A0A8YD02_ARUDO
MPVAGDREGGGRGRLRGVAWARGRREAW